MIEEYLAYEDRLAQEGKLDESCASAIWGWTLSEDYFRLVITLYFFYASLMESLRY